GGWAAFRAGELGNDGGWVGAGRADGSEACLDAGLDGTVRPDDRRGEEARRVEHLGPGRLERGAGARGPGEGRAATQAGVGQGTVRGRREAPTGVGGAGIDRRVRVRRAAHVSGPRADVVRRAIEAYRFEARGAVRVWLRGGGDAV